MELSEKLKYLRNNNNISQNELSKLSGVSIESIKNYETNKTLPMNEQVIKIARALGVSSNVLNDNNNLNFSLEYPQDLIILIIHLIKNDTLLLKGSRNKQGYLDKNSLYLEFSNPTLSNFFKLHEPLIKIIESQDSIFITQIIEWEYLYNDYMDCKKKCNNLSYDYSCDDIKYKLGTLEISIAKI